jgi:hypothetical protein
MAIATPGACEFDPFERLTLSKVTFRFGPGFEELLRRGNDREVFSFCVTGGEPMWPAFQFVPPWTGATMRECMVAIGAPDGATAYHFFATPCPELERLTPVELLVGLAANARPLPAGAVDLLRLSERERRKLVFAAARCFSADISGR